MKKSFTQVNPAMQFITAAEDEAARQEDALLEEASAERARLPESKEASLAKFAEMAKGTGAGAADLAETIRKVIGQQVRNAPVPDGYKTNPLFIEKKSRRLQLLLQPSLYEQIRAMASSQGVSVNELIHSILETVTKEKEQ